MAPSSPIMAVAFPIVRSSWGKCVPISVSANLVALRESGKSVRGLPPGQKPGGSGGSPDDSESLTYAKTEVYGACLPATFCFLRPSPSLEMRGFSTW